MTTIAALSTTLAIWFGFGWAWAAAHYYYVGPPKLTIPGLGPAPFWEGLLRVALQMGLLGPTAWRDSPSKGLGAGWAHNRRIK